MKAPDDRLSRCTSALLLLVEARDEVCAQHAALGLAEEHVELLRGNYARAALGLLADHGYTARSFEEALAERTCSRFVEAEIGAALLGGLPADARPLTIYRIPVGFSDDEGERHVPGTVEVCAHSRSQARGLAIDAAFDERVRCGCSPWTRVEHHPRNG